MPPKPVPQLEQIVSEGVTVVLLAQGRGVALARRRWRRRRRDDDARATGNPNATTTLKNNNAHTHTLERRAVHLDLRLDRAAADRRL